MGARGRPWTITPGGRFSKDYPGVREATRSLVVALGGDKRCLRALRGGEKRRLLERDKRRARPDPLALRYVDNSDSSRCRWAQRCNVAAARAHCADSADDLGEWLDGRDSGLDLDQCIGLTRLLGFAASESRHDEEWSRDALHRADGVRL